MINNTISQLKTIALLYLSLLFFSWVNPAIAETTVEQTTDQITFLGLTLEEPLPASYKTCTISPFQEGYTDERCITTFEGSYFVRFVWDETDTQDRYIELPKQEIPFFSLGRNIAVIVDRNGKLVYLSVVTKGIQVQDKLFEELKKQFGEPTTFIVVDNSTPKAIPGFLDSYYAFWNKKDYWVRFVGQYGYPDGSLEIGLQRLFKNGFPKNFY